DSAPLLVKRINNAFMRADQIHHLEEKNGIDWFLPIVADGEAGFGGVLNVFEFTKNMIRSGVAAVHFEDQLSAHKKCGHLGGKVLTPTKNFIETLTSARLAADVYEVPTLIVARTDANSAKLLSNDSDPVDNDFITGDRSSEGFFYYSGGLDASIARGTSFAPYSDLVWFETSKPDIDEARTFSEAVRGKYPGQMLAYNCSPSFNWSKHMTEEQASRFQSELGELGYKFQFVTLAGFHQLNYGMFELATGYKERGMGEYMKLQNAEFDAEARGYQAVKHQRFVGTSYFDEVNLTITQGKTSTSALEESTEAEQFH
ncbi:MAG: isocitrate lyase/phosphoenolpyruvate mutase family protein, partial [Candidatus Heimdallarchaeota archaeon]|nr:isocitrate lyase/phosphoenolpyruvate mutase family protein [Candidatus Heimdallarchaeota archaeon]